MSCARGEDEKANSGHKRKASPAHDLEDDPPCAPKKARRRRSPGIQASEDADAVKIRHKQEMRERQEQEDLRMEEEDRMRNRGAFPRSTRALPEDPVAAARTAVAMATIQPMTQFMQQFPHTNPDRECRLAIQKMQVVIHELDRTKTGGASGAAASSSAFSGLTPHPQQQKQAQRHVIPLPDDKKDLSLVQLRELHYEQSQARPIELELLLDARKMLLPPRYRTGNRILSQQEASQLIRANRHSLPLLSAQIESEMMVQAGTWFFPQPGGDGVWRNLPPCCYGEQCIGRMNMIHGLTEPIVFMRAMTEQQWAHLKATGEAPFGEWPCVLDHKYHSHHYILQSRTLVRQGHEFKREDPDEVYQFWYNKVDQPGGFKREFVLEVQDHEILVAPLGVVSLELMPAKRASPTSPWYVTQTEMIFDTRLAELQRPVLGESVQDF